MNKTINTIKMAIVVCLIGLSICSFNVVQAASFAVGVSSSTVAPGGTFAVYVQSDGIGRVNLSVSNGSISTSSVWVENGGADQTISVTAGGSGTVSVTATPQQGFSDSMGNEYNPGARSASVQIVAASKPGGGSNASGGSNGVTNTPAVKDDRSANTNLASLTISEGQLDPAFSAGNTNYTVNLAASVNKVVVEATPEDAKSKVAGVGEVALNAGENKVAVSVTAENGDVKEYIINAIVDEKPEVYVTYNKKKLGVVRNLKDVQAPTGFEETVVTINKKEIKAWKNEAMNMTILYLINEKTSARDFYVYDTKKKEITSILKPIAILGRNLYAIDISKEKQKREGFVYKKIVVDGTELMGWEYESPAFKNYYVLLVLNEQGNEVWYQYEKNENTMQFYSNAAPITQKKYEEVMSGVSIYKTMSLVFGGLSIVLGGACIASLFMKRKK